MAKAEVAILVSSYQRPRHVERVLISIAVQHGVEGQLEVVVTDDGSTDETPEVVERFARSVSFPVRFTTHPHETYQLARCRNEGVATSEAPYIIFLDGDCLIPPDHVLQQLRHRRRRVALAGYCCSFDQNTTERITFQTVRAAEYLQWAPRRELRKLAKLDHKSRLYSLLRHPRKPRLFGGNIGIWREDYVRVNGYDEQFEGWGCEDDDLNLRLRQAGTQVESILRWTRTYHMWHPVGETVPKRWRDGNNAKRIQRGFRFTRCRNGLHKLGAEGLTLRVVGRPARPQAASALLPGHSFSESTTTDGEPAEIEVLFVPGAGRFSGKADCNMLVVLEDSPQADRCARRAHVVVADRPLPGVDPSLQFKHVDFEQAFRAVA